MAWSAPRTWTVGEVVTASIMNAHVRDNLLYLKDSPVFDGSPTVGATGSAQTLRVYGNADGSANGPVLIKNTSAGTIGAGLALDASGATSGRSFSLLSLASVVAPVGGFGIYDNTASAFRLAIDSSGNVGMGTQGPAGKFHVQSGTKGMVFVTASAVTTIQTLLVAGTITKGAVIWLTDLNNTGNAIVSSGLMALALTATQTYTNNDTLSVNVTAGGALTITRTIGTNGTHDITAIVQFQ